MPEAIYVQFFFRQIVAFDGLFCVESCTTAVIVIHGVFYMHFSGHSLYYTHASNTYLILVSCFVAIFHKVKGWVPFFQKLEKRGPMGIF